MIARATLASLLAGVSVGACAFRGADGETIAVFPDSLFDQVRTIAVAPVVETGDFVVPGDAAAVIEAELGEQLQQAGFAVVPSFEYLGIWQHIADEWGGFFDPYTGNRDEELFTAATRRLRAELRERFQADVVVLPELWEGMVPFRDGVAVWEGTSQVVFGAHGLSGMVRALSLVLVFEDSAGAEVYSNGTGLATIEAWHNQSWLPLVLEGVLGDSRLVSPAVTRVLAPIRAARTADSTRVR